MNISASGIDFIKSFEGFSATPYKDGAGFPTVGYGHKMLKGETFPDGVDTDSALSLLETDLQPVVSIISSLVKTPLTQNEFDALCSLAYNIGCGAFRNSTLLKCLNENDFDKASAEFTKWDHAGGEVVDGLLRRREAEQELFLK